MGLQRMVATSLALGVLIASCGGTPGTPGDKATVAASATAAPTVAPKPLTLRYGQVSLHAGHWPMFIADAKGFWKDENIDFQFTMFNTATDATLAATSGSTDITGLTTSDIITAMEKAGSSLDIVGVFGQSYRPVYSLIVTADIKSYADLQGKPLGVSGINSSDAFFLKEMLKANGVDVTKVDLIAAGGTPQRIAGLQQGTIKAAMLGQPFDFQAVRGGLKSLGLSTTYLNAFGWQLEVAKKSWAAQNSDLMLRTLRVWIRAHKYLYDPANKQEALKILVDRLKADPADALATYDQNVTKVGYWSQAGEMPLAAVNASLQFLVGANLIKAGADPAKYFDWSYLRKLGVKIEGYP